MKRIVSLLLASVLLFSLAACNKGDTNGGDKTSDADKVILMVSFGTSYNETREKTIDVIEADVEKAYPEWEVRRAFTAQTVIDILADRDKLEIDNVKEAMDRLVADGVKEVIVQPTHVMNGAEYDDVVAEVTAYADKFDSLKMGQALLTSVEDYETAIDSLFAEITEAEDEDTAIVFMGHGTHHNANSTYSQLELMMHGAGYENAFVGTVEGYPSLDDVMNKVAAGKYSKVILYPLMVVAGDHASNDMAGDEADTWKTAFKEADYEVECRLVGLGENAGIRDMYIDHVKAAMDGKPIATPAVADVKEGANDPEKKAILVVSFGTSFNDSRVKTIEAIEADVEKAYPDWEVRRAFTAQTVIDILADRDKLEVDNVAEAMEKLIADGYGTVVVQPTHIMAGAEYDDVVATVNSYSKYISSLTISEPVLMDSEDYVDVVDAVAANVSEAGADDVAVVLMGHGTHHAANSTYSQLQNTFWSEGYENVFVGTVEGFPTYDDVLAQLKALGAKKVVMYPFMIVAGDHANNDMAGDEADAWKTMLTEAGYDVECRIEGLGENAGVRGVILDHLSEATK